MSGLLYWMDAAVPFRDGETIAAALRRHGIDDFGPAAGGQRGRYFCGIGSCQACMVSIDGECTVEACLTPAREGMRLRVALPLMEDDCHG
jgi:predicted molibdopterin-dependent oxidoreductase YjgC